MSKRRQRAPEPSAHAEGETWQVARVPLRTWVRDRQQRLKPFRPWVVLAVSTSGPQIVGVELVGSEKPSPEKVAALLQRAMAKPEVGPSRRPDRVVAAEPELLAGLGPRLAPLAIRCEPGETPLLAEALDSLEAELGVQERVPGLLETPGVTPELVGRVFAAAADFHRHAPWRLVGDEFAVAVQSPAESQDVRYAIVMGGGGITYGLAIYRSLEDLATAYSGLPPMIVTALLDHEALTYEDATELPFTDLEAIERYSWEVAGEDVYPLLLVYTREGEFKRPGPEDLAWYEVALRSIPAYVEAHPKPRRSRAVPTEATLTVAAGGGEVTTNLRYVPVPRQRRFRRIAGHAA